MRLDNLSQVLLHATYKDGQVGQQNLTEAHFWAEHHPYKIEYLFLQGKKIPTNLYVARLIQHYYIFSALEKALDAFKNDANLKPFFRLNCIKELKRAFRIVQDLRKLGIDREKLCISKATDATRRYVEHIHQLTPEQVLIHYSLQVAGLMFGGPIIKSRYFVASNKLPGDQIPFEEYDFSEATKAKKLKSDASLFSTLDEALKQISVDEVQSPGVLQEAISAYSYMAEIYSDLLWNEVYLKQIRYAAFFMATAGAVFLAWSMQECAKVSVSHCFGY